MKRDDKVFVTSRSHRLSRYRKMAFILFPTAIVLCAVHFYVFGQDKSGFPDGYDAVQAAPRSHKVVFENEFVRVLQVTIPPPGTTEPMHHHHWPGFFLDWDTGGGSSHIRYHRADGTVRDSPAKEEAHHPGSWSIHWMNPEPMHAIEVVETPKSAEPGSGRAAIVASGDKVPSLIRSSIHGYRQHRIVKMEDIRRNSLDVSYPRYNSSSVSSGASVGLENSMR